MKNFINILGIALLLTSMGLAQVEEPNYKNRARNTIRFDLSGGTSNLAASYERIVPLSKTEILSIKAGAGFIVSSSEWSLWHSSRRRGQFCFPHHISYNSGGIKAKNGIERHFFEFGFEGLFLPNRKADEGKKYTVYSLIGYRFHPVKADKFSCKVCYKLPLLAAFAQDKAWFSGSSFGAHLFPEISLGYTF